MSLRLLLRLTWQALALLCCLSGFSVVASAAPLDDAQSHFKAIASGDVAAVLQGYAEQAELQWGGGPLDGRYVGADAIRTAWTRFAQAQGPLKASVTELDEAANPKGSTVTARVLFEGKAPIRVRYVLTYRAGLLVQETWQVDAKPVQVP